jgi:uncharacterized membrane protein
MKIYIKNTTAQPLFKNYKTQYIYTLIEDLEVVLLFERNNAGLKKLSSFAFSFSPNFNGPHL